MQHNKDVETHTLLLASLRMESLDALNNPPSLFYWSRHYLCILRIHFCHLWRGPSLRRNFFNSRMHTAEKKCKLPILSYHRETQQIRRCHFGISLIYLHFPSGLYRLWGFSYFYVCVWGMRVHKKAEPKHYCSCATFAGRAGRKKTQKKTRSPHLISALIDNEWIQTLAWSKHLAEGEP